MTQTGLLTSAATAALLGIPRGTLRRLLSQFSRELSPPMYGRNGHHPRRVRWLTEPDVAVVRQKLAEAVKRNRSPA